jgi:hypothetical protein
LTNLTRENSPEEDMAVGELDANPGMFTDAGAILRPDVDPAAPRNAGRMNVC